MGEVFQPIGREGEGMAPIGSEEESGAKWEREFVWEREREQKRFFSYFNFF